MIIMCVCTLSYSVVSNSVRTHELAHQVSLSMELDLPNPKVKPASPESPASGLFSTAPSGKP